MPLRADASSLHSKLSVLLVAEDWLVELHALLRKRPMLRSFLEDIDCSDPWSQFVCSPGALLSALIGTPLALNLRLWFQFRKLF
jgi:hypothetical protein